MFWFWAVVLTLIAVLFAVFPLLRRARNAITDDGLNADILHNQLAELGRDMNEGTINAEEYEQARIDLERAYLDNSSTEGLPVENGRPSIAMALVLLMLISVTAWLIYDRVGMPPEVLNIAMSAAKPHSGRMDASAMPDIDLMIERVRKRLVDDPSDLASWSMLARSLHNLNRLDEAQVAFRGAIDNGLHDAATYAEYADLLAHNSGNLSTSSEAFQYIQKALELDPDHITALWLAGSAHRLEGNFPAVLQYWEHLYRVLPEDSDLAPIIRNNIEAVRGMIEQ